MAEFTKKQGKGIIKEHTITEPIIDDDMVGGSIKSTLEHAIKYIALGKGFKKGSPEAIEHAKKMRESRPEKKESAKMESKTRYKKGSPEAIEMGKRLAEARRKKKEAQEPKPEEKKKRGTSKKPWFYIGDIPKGYREATEDEAILNKMVSRYGKYQVDKTKWEIYRDYNIFLSLNQPDTMKTIIMNGLKVRIMRTLKEIEIYENKLENPKYEKDRDTYEDKLENAEKMRKYAQAGWNFYYKYFCEKDGIPYKKQKFQLQEQPEIKYEPKPEIKREPTPVIDIRTGKKAKTLEEILKEEKTDNYIFERTTDKGLELINLKKSYFTPTTKKLKSKYAERLYDRHIVLDSQYYTNADAKKYLYTEHITGSGFIKRLPPNKNEIVQSVLFNKSVWKKPAIIKWIVKNGYIHDDIDEKPLHYRVRQYNPEDLKGYHYITKSLSNGVSLVIAIKSINDS